MITKTLIFAGLFVAMFGMGLRLVIPTFDHATTIAFVGFYTASFSMIVLVFNVEYSSNGNKGMKIACAGAFVSLSGLLAAQALGLPEIEKPIFNFGALVTFVGCMLSMFSIQNK